MFTDFYLQPGDTQNRFARIEDCIRPRNYTRNATIQHVPLSVIPAFRGNRKGDAEMPESHFLSLLIQGKEIPVFFAIPLSRNGQKTGMTFLNVEIVATTE